MIRRRSSPGLARHRRTHALDNSSRMNHVILLHSCFIRRFTSRSFSHKNIRACEAKCFLRSENTKSYSTLQTSLKFISVFDSLLHLEYLEAKACMITHKSSRTYMSGEKWRGTRNAAEERSTTRKHLWHLSVSADHNISSKPWNTLLICMLRPTILRAQKGYLARCIKGWK